MLLAPNASSFKPRMSCSRCFLCAFLHVCPLCVLFGAGVVEIHFSTPVLSIPSSMSRLYLRSSSRSRVFPFSFGVGSVCVNLQAYTFVFSNASHIYISIFRLFVGNSIICRIRPLLSRLSFMVSAPFYWKSLI